MNNIPNIYVTISNYKKVCKYLLRSYFLMNTNHNMMSNKSYTNPTHVMTSAKC